MTHWLQFAGETPPDPIWLRTLSIGLPVAGTVIVAILTGPKISDRLRERRKAKAAGEDPAEATLVTDAKIAEVATVEAINNPIMRLFIDDLHMRLSKAHEEMAQLHTIRAGDAATIARLTEQLADAEDRCRAITQSAQDKSSRVRELIRLVRQLRAELEETRSQLRDCYEEGDRRDTAKSTDPWAGPRQQGGDGDLG